MQATPTYTPSFLSILRRGCTDPWFLVLVPFALLIFVLLLGYYPTDSGWATSGSTPQVQHFAGKFGAYTADVLLSFLGYSAYLLPIGLCAIAWSSAKHEESGGEIILWKTIGLVGAILSLSGILTFHWQSAINSVAITGGGIVGQKISGELLGLMPVFTIMFLYTLVFLVAISLIFNIKWLAFFAAIGYFPAKILQSMLEAREERLQLRENPPLEPEISQAHRDSILSRLKPRRSREIDESILPSQTDVQSDIDLPNHSPVMANEDFVAETKGMTLAERLAFLSAKRRADEKESLTEPFNNSESPLHRSEPVLNWSDYKLERIKPNPAIVIPPQMVKPVERQETETSTPSSHSSAADNLFSAYDAFADNESNALDVAEDEDFFSERTAASASSTPSTALDDAPTEAESEAAPLRIRSSALASNFHIPAQTTDDYRLPTLSLLKPSPPKRTPDSASQFQQLAPLVEAALQNYRLDVRVVGVDVGPVVTRLELELAPGIKVNQLTNLDKDLARSLSVPSVRVVEVIPGKPYVGLEIPNKHREIVHLREILESTAYQQEKSPLTIVLGADIAGAPKVANLAKMPHLLVAGTTGSGKSVAINVMLASMLYKASPDELKLILIDPKMLEMSMYEDIPHLLTPVVTDMNDAENALRWAVAEMERRYMLMAAFKVRNIMSFNEVIRAKQARGERIDDPLWRAEDNLGLANQPPQISALPYIVIVIDELADMMMAVGKKVEELIARIAQKARAAGIHLILATQRPSVDVITGLIKANVPTRLAFQVSSKIDSRTIIDGQGAETLLGHGDGLYVPPGSSAPLRVHGAFIDDGEVDALTAYLKAQAKPKYEESITNPVPSSLMGAFGAQEKNDDPELDPLYDEACQVVIESGKTSISYLQRRLQIGYNRAARIIEAMETAGLLSSADNNGARKIIGGHQDDY